MDVRLFFSLIPFPDYPIIHGALGRVLFDLCAIDAYRVQLPEGWFEIRVHVLFHARFRDKALKFHGRGVLINRLKTSSGTFTIYCVRKKEWNKNQNPLTGRRNNSRSCKAGDWELLRYELGKIIYYIVYRKKYTKLCEKILIRIEEEKKSCA